MIYSNSKHKNLSFLLWNSL